MPHFMIILIPYINLLNLSWIMKCLFWSDMEPLRFCLTTGCKKSESFTAMENEYLYKTICIRYNQKP